MRAWLPGFLVAAGVAVFLVWGSLADPKSPPQLSTQIGEALATGLVASVTDGDTIRLTDNRRVRLAQIDAPERAQGECYAEEAAEELERLAPVGAQVRLRLDRALGAKDENGRFLAYVFNRQENLNLQLVELGAAAPYFRRGVRGRYADALMGAARRARADLRGLWGVCPGTNLDPDRPLDARS